MDRSDHESLKSDLPTGPVFGNHFLLICQTSTRAIVLDGKCLRTKAEQDHDLGYELLKRIAQVMEERLHATRLQLMNVYEVDS
jgi:CRP/FNR family transcriptional regulator, cyclic AMP receptor protein